MVPALRDFEHLLPIARRNAVDEAVLLVDAARPPARQLVPQRLRLTKAGERLAPRSPSG
jgi:hypothetical protein